jgi:Icc-related predicted phosphoesterase
MELFPNYNRTKRKNNKNTNRRQEEDIGTKVRPILHHSIGGNHEFGVTIVCISDTHGLHRELQMPPGEADILVHAGDYTCYGSRDHVLDFNAWLGELGDQYTHKIVVHGNHDYNASWKSEARSLLSNATLLVHESIELEFQKPHNSQGKEHVDTTTTEMTYDSQSEESVKLKLFGTAFSWPAKEATSNASLYAIDESIDILISHGPAKGYLDVRNLGCPSLLSTIERTTPKIVISGHIHGGRGVQDVCFQRDTTWLPFRRKNYVKNESNSDPTVTFVNAANAGNHDQIKNQPVVLHL